MKDNRIVIDLNKCQYARFYYKNQYGEVVNLLPKRPTVHAHEFNPEEMHVLRSMTMGEYARTHKLLDRWEPYVRFQLQANRSLTYSGEKAISLWDAWCKKIFKAKKR